MISMPHPNEFWWHLRVMGILRICCQKMHPCFLDFEIFFGFWFWKICFILKRFFLWRIGPSLSLILDELSFSCCGYWMQLAVKVLGRSSAMCGLFQWPKLINNDEMITVHTWKAHLSFCTKKKHFLANLWLVWCSLVLQSFASRVITIPNRMPDLTSLEIPPNANCL